MVTTVIRIIAWEDLTDEQQRAWVKYRAQLTMEGGSTLFDMARRLRLETATRLSEELRHPDTPARLTIGTELGYRISTCHDDIDLIRDTIDQWLKQHPTDD